MDDLIYNPGDVAAFVVGRDDDMSIVEAGASGGMGNPVL